MLVLGRYKDQTICIGDDIEVMVVRCAGEDGQVRIGIKAPAHVRIDRKECREAADYDPRRKDGHGLNPH